MKSRRRSHVRTAVRPFYLYRREDVSGVSGTGIVAVGVILPSGHAVMEWCSRWPTVTIFQSIEQVERIHGHGGRTSIGWGVPPRTIANLPQTGLPRWWCEHKEMVRWIRLEKMATEMLKVPGATFRPWWLPGPKDDKPNLAPSVDLTEYLVPFRTWIKEKLAAAHGRPKA